MAGGLSWTFDAVTIQTTVATTVLNIPSNMDNVMFDGTAYNELFGFCNASLIGSSAVLDVWLQTSPDEGNTWRDIANWHFTAASVQFIQVQGRTGGGAAPIAASDAALASNTVVQGTVGSRFRLKYRVTGGTTPTTFQVSIYLKD